MTSAKESTPTPARSWAPSTSALRLLFVLVAAYRVSLIGRGAMAFPDETWYYQSGLLLQDLRTGQFSTLLSHLAFSWGRPGDVVLKLVPAALQAIPFALGVPTSNPLSLIIPTACNVAVSLVSLWLFHRICLVVFEGDRLVSLTAAAVYSLLVSTNLYVRHVLPYDWALAVALCAIWLALSRQPTGRSAFGVGCLAMAIAAVYPGYYLLTPLPGVVLLHRAVAARSASGWRVATAFGAGVAVVLAAFEILCRLGGLGFVSMARQLSETVRQGSFEEGWLFLPRYLVEVERYTGVLLLAGFGWWLWRVLTTRAGAGRWRPLDALVGASVLAWMWQAAAASEWHAMVLYGRLIHPWFVVLVLAATDGVRSLPRRTWTVATCGVAIVVAVISWAPSASAYYRLAYPADVLYGLRIDTGRLSADHMRCEMQPIHTYASPAPLNRTSGYPYSTRTDYVLVNFCLGVPGAGRSGSAALSASLTRVYAAPHFMTFPAYAFEGLSPADRREVARGRYQVAVYAPTR